jgi:hypothetical protein
MTPAELKHTCSDDQPPAGLSPPLAALWWSAKGHWEKAHALVMNDETREAAWVHAHLHREESDLANAAYWYRRAGLAEGRGPLAQEWQEVTAVLLGRA